jgi:hypothetical protein
MPLISSSLVGKPVIHLTLFVNMALLYIILGVTKGWWGNLDDFLAEAKFTVPVIVGIPLVLSGMTYYREQALGPRLDDQDK